MIFLRFCRPHECAEILLSLCIILDSGQMARVSEQKVVVVCDFSEHMNEVIVHGARLADVLQKELCLLTFLNGRGDRNELFRRLSNLNTSLQTRLSTLHITHLVLKGSLRDRINELVESYEAVLLVEHQSKIGSCMKAFQESSIPFLFVNGNDPEHLQYKSALVPVDFRKASKDASLWASYLGRFNKSLIQIVYAHETKSEELQKLNRNVEFFRKFLSSLNVRHLLVAGKSSSWRICDEVLARAHEWKGDVMIFSGSSNISLLDLLIGLPEKKLVSKAGKLPVMLINPRKDICMMCD